MVRYGVHLARRVPTIISKVLQARAAPLVPSRSPFNGAIGGDRVMAFASLSLADVLRSMDVHGVTANDLILAVLAGATRRYLQEIGGSSGFNGDALK